MNSVRCTLYAAVRNGNNIRKQNIKTANEHQQQQ
jgi:hypothetical protein